MDDQKPMQAVLTSRSSIDQSQKPQALALFNSDGTAAIVPQKLGALPATLITTATAVGTAAKTTATAEPIANSLVAVKFTNGNSANSPTLAFNGGTARAIQLSGVASTSAELALGANSIAVFFFDGTILHQVGVYT